MMNLYFREPALPRHKHQLQSLLLLAVTACLIFADNPLRRYTGPEIGHAQSGLVAAYSFDEGSGSSLNDVSGNANNGIISGATWSTTAKFGRALSFDGVNDVVTIADSPTLDLSSALTMEAWVRPTATNNWRTVLLKEVPGELAYGMYSNDGSRPSAWLRINGTSQSANGTFRLTANTWSHLAATYDGTALRLYVNGTLLRTRALTGAVQTSSSPLRIGGNTIWGEYFRGQIDEVRIYNRALAASEIQSDMNAPVGGPSDTSPPTVSITGPTDGSTVVNTITVSATASDNVAVSGVQFLLDGAPLGAEDTVAPYSITWTTTSTANGAHTLSARARDAAGNVTVSASVGVTVNNDLSPPQFLQIGADSITASSAVIAWETNEASTSQVEYGLTASYGSSTVLASALVTSHSQTLTNLAASTLYHYRARSTDAAGNQAVSGDQTFTTAAPAPDFTFTVTPSSRLIPPTGTGSYDVDVAYVNGFTSSSVDLWVTGLPAGATGTFAFDPMPHQGRTTLTVNSNNVAPGTYALTAGATAEGITHSQNLTLVVSTAADFSLTASPSVQNVARGNATSYQLSLGATNGFSDAVALSVSGLPNQTTASFSPNPIVPPGTATLTVDTGTATPAGQYPLVVTGEAGALTRTVSLTLIVSSQTATWAVDTIGATGVPNNSVRVGAVRTDGLNRVYIGTIATGRMLEYSWNGVSWSAAVDVGGSPSGDEIHNFNIGAARSDSQHRIYAASTDRNVYEMWHSGSAWQQLTVGTLDDQAMHTAVGDGRGDGIARLYAVSIQSAYEFTWTGSSWSGQRIASTPGAHGIAVAPGRGPGVMSLFVASISSGTFELRYNGASWVRTGMGDSDDVRDVDWGVGRNDGIARIYSALLDGRIRELVWNGNGWTITHLPGVGAPLIHAYVLAGRNDGINRVYGSSGNGKVYEFSWNGSSWSVFNMGGGPDYMYGLHFGPGRNDGTMRLYGADRGSVNSVYEYTWTAPGAVDATPPDPPTNLTAAGGVGQVNLTWNPAFDNVGVAGYNVHRSNLPGLTADSANRIGQTAATSFTNSGLPSGTYYYRVIAFDASGNLSAPSSEASAAATSDTEAPTVAITSPGNGATVSGMVTISATATDNVAVAGVRFLVDGVTLGAEDTSAPYSIGWDSIGAANGNHQLTAVARDAAGNATTAATITVVVSNTGPSALVLALGFNEGTGSAAADSSGQNNAGTLANASWVAGKFGTGVQFNGSSSWVTIADAASLDLTNSLTISAWVRPTTLTSDWRTILLKERPGGLAYALYATDGASQPPAAYVNIGGVDIAAVAPSLLSLNTWTHLAVTFNGTTLQLYVNGALISTRTTSGAVVTSSSPLRIGGNGVWGEYFAGAIDEVRLYNRALTQVEIQTAMNTPLP